MARFCSVLGTGRPARGMLDERSVPPGRQSIRVRTGRVNSILGTDLDAAAIASYLAPIGFTTTPAGDVAGIQDVVPPSFRPDVTTEIEVIEEVARHHGYRNIARTVPKSPYVGALTPYQRGRRHLREVMAGAGCDEASGSPLLGPGDHARAGLEVDEITAAEPLAREESILRASLLPGLLRAVAFNQRHRVGDVRLFEIGNVFLASDRSAELPDEIERAAVVLAGDGDDAEAAKRVLDVVADAFHLEDMRVEPAVVPGLHPTRTATVTIAGNLAGHVGEVDPDVLAAHDVEGRVGFLGLDVAAVVPSSRSYVQARPLSRFPSSDIDLAFVVDDSVPAGGVERALRSAGGDLLVDLRLFDVYRGGQLASGRRSLAYRLRFHSLDHTLTDEEVAAVRRRCIDAVESTFPAELRG